MSSNLDMSLEVSLIFLLIYSGYLDPWDLHHPHFPVQLSPNPDPHQIFSTNHPLPQLETSYKSRTYPPPSKLSSILTPPPMFLCLQVTCLIDNHRYHGDGQSSHFLSHDRIPVEEFPSKTTRISEKMRSSKRRPTDLQTATLMWRYQTEIYRSLTANNLVEIYRSLTANNLVEIYRSLTANNLAEIYRSLTANNLVEIYRSLTANNLAEIYRSLTANNLAEIYRSLTANNLAEIYRSLTANNLVEIYWSRTDNNLVEIYRSLTDNNLAEIYRSLTANNLAEIYRSLTANNLVEIYWSRTDNKCRLASHCNITE